MALQIDLSAAQRRAGFDRVIVIGRSADGPATEDGEALANRIDALHYTDGFAFVPQGAPTNNTPDASSAFDRKDPGYERSFAVERQDSLLPAGDCDARALAGALGLDPTIFSHVEAADRTDHFASYHMAVALWPATLGYFLQQIMADTFSDADVAGARDFVLGSLRARGPLPAIRAGRTPYGVLPVMALRGWNPRAPTAVEQNLQPVLLSAKDIWLKAAAASTPLIRPGGDPDAQLTSVLGMDASSSSYRARYVLGEDFFWNWLGWLGIDDTMRGELWNQAGQPSIGSWSGTGYGPLSDSAA